MILEGVVGRWAAPSKAQLEVEARDATIAALEQRVEELKAKLHAENPPAEDIIAERDQLKRENQVLKNRNVQHARENRRLAAQVAKLEASTAAMKDEMRTVLHNGNSTHVPPEGETKFVNIDEFDDHLAGSQHPD